MEPIPSSNKKWEIYMIIIIGSLGLIGIFGRAITNRNGNTISDNDPIILTNSIIEDKEKLPDNCKKTISLFDCVIGRLPQNENHQSLSLYYQTTISERNILDRNKLNKACSSQYDYIINLKGKYKEIITLCL